MYSKYKELQNEEWVRDKILNKKLPYKEIANIIGNGCKETNVAQARRRFNIPSSRRPRVVGRSCFDKLNDIKWLKDVYLTKKLSSCKIAKIVGDGCTFGHVIKALQRMNIPTRNRSEGKLINRGDTGFKFIRDVIEGSLLGDGGLSKYNIDGNANFNLTSIHKEYLEYYSNIIFKDSDRIFVKSVESKDNEIRGKKYISKPSFYLLSKVEFELTKLYNEWYPYNIKIIPDNILVTKRTLLHWFMEDGYSYRVTRRWGKRKEKITNSIRIQFSTQSFNKDDLDMLCSKIYYKFGLKMYPRLHKRHGKIRGSGYYIELSESKEQRELFYRIIGKCPVKCFEYKWKLS